MLHKSTFQYLKPTDKQLTDMSDVRELFANVSEVLDQALPDGPDKTYVLRHLRECAMWANICITRQADGSPRLD